jgi:hypothetical protein
VLPAGSNARLSRLVRHRMLHSPNGKSIGAVREAIKVGKRAPTPA